MFTVYILHSAVRKKYYVGFTGGDMQERLAKHNTAHAGFTGKCLDWLGVYIEAYDEKQQAMGREKEIKKWKSRQMIEALINKRIA